MLSYQYLCKYRQIYEFFYEYLISFDIIIISIYYKKRME